MVTKPNVNKTNNEKEIITIILSMYQIKEKVNENLGECEEQTLENECG